jgi:hypothetical protein
MYELLKASFVQKKEKRELKELVRYKKQHDRRTGKGIQQV